MHFNNAPIIGPHGPIIAVNIAINTAIKPGLTAGFMCIILASGLDFR